MLRIEDPSNARANAAARPAMLLTLAIGVAIGASLTSPPVSGAEPRIRRAMAERSSPVQPVTETVRPRPLRVIPLPTRAMSELDGVRAAR